MNTLKLVIVGGHQVGKTCLLLTMCGSRYPGDYIPTCYCGYSRRVNVDNRSYEVGFFDVSGLEEYKRLRVLVYPQTDVFLLCFSVVSQSSFNDLRTEWYPEIVHHCPGVAFLVVGTKVDLRDDLQTQMRLKENDQSAVTVEMGEHLATELSAAKYVECSSLSGQGLDTIFNEAVAAALTPPPPKKKEKKCVVL
ncbi:P-loop containing nucleoside triphosphate hydrolase protein [Auriculariales sp. MPI-PUGE-AT-0066]|nr:P-loop containing nucleoside triphosphate hydrolase protein [Auriculariales sp. MPI-PUGE-AT-0066]